MGRRAVGLDRYDRLDEVRALVGDRPDERAGLGMDEQNGRADPVEQGHGGIAIERLLQGKIDQRGELARIELVERRISRLAAARPLSVEMCLRPQIEALRRDEALLEAVQIRG